MKDQPTSSTNGLTRRAYLKTSLLGAAGAIFVPTIVPSTVFGKNAPSNKINIGQIGFGRIAQGHDLPETLNYDVARVMAVSDLDRKRKRKGKEFIEGWYNQKKGKKNYVDVQMYDDYREMLQNPDIDAVIISTPDHWHAQPAIEAALAGKDIYLQKPASLTVEEGRMMSDILHKTGRVFQIGSQQRSVKPWPQFKRACELVRNGRIGELHTVKIGLPGDPPGGSTQEMPIPGNLNYDMWLGSTPYVYYTEERVHPQADFSRPGWLRCRQFGAGMITGWGAHHVDTAHWGMGTEYTGPIEVEAEADFPKSGLWTVHGDFNVTAKYANGVTMLISGSYPNGVRFEGSEGWIFVSRGDVGVTASDPTKPSGNSEAFQASDPKILKSEIGPDEIHLYESSEQHGNWLDCIKSRRQTVAPAEIAHRSCSACLVAHIAMQLPRKLYWDPLNERFKNDDEANAMLALPQRYPYGIHHIPALRRSSETGLGATFAR
ncbi:Predicted dehydrogenase [Catalinimonas alkaloidigena]|uniref:Predicted dehydrogenase n=1 Tax=Catalinimonas alkaloidigena TaxID=1075417 RepID=A0A1G9K1E2_9BACT|nr:Gfo/Idh/MocA family oxidoreductase [Catalinimonas alkaloidigena]SDL43568.1 Predicted dehydrogenase [Catalinimonas alkaloidigena]